MTNPQAFPSHGSMGEVVQEGMTLRDYFAAKAMQGLLAHSCDQAPNLIHEREQSVAKNAFIVADAMLKEREK